MPIVPVKKPAIQERTPPEDSLPRPAPPRMNMERRHSPPRLPPPPPLMDLYSPHQQQHQQQQEMYQHEYMRDERVPPLYRGSFSPPPPPPHAPLPPPAHSSPVIPHEPPPAHLDKPWQPYKHHRQRFSIDEPPASSMHDSYLSPLDESPLSRVRQDEVMSGKSDPPSHGRISDEDSDCSVEDRSLRTPSSPLDKTSPELPLPSVRPRSIFLEPSRMADYSSKLFGILDCINRRPDEFAQMKLDKDNLESVWAIADISFMHHVKCVVQYVRRIPGFGELCLDDQIALTQEAVYPVTLIFHARKYNLETGEHSWFINTKVEKEFVLKYFPHFGALGKHFETTGLTIKLLDLNSVEYGLLTLMAVFAPSDFVKLKDRTAMLAFQDDIMDVMMYYDRHYRGSDSRLGQMLARLPELRKANVEHSLIAAQAQAERPSMDFGAMWRDLFMSNPIVN
ncbi:hypothetical protein CAPTEDRAFT_209972 [Capitella teleta]|uniref:NR LBD domain-containing protein n=1 Tax=Capitella teleta TaxID=283909 RepID=R7V8D2_CAPTE|nr:hypothetical protein CAPTEDRAFT_209972 [Capitella teleta]|eukprot:ELU14752.1 hypothetical protein CAPTEDRAFT_209972 [Capitella teleta]